MPAVPLPDVFPAAFANSEGCDFRGRLVGSIGSIIRPYNIICTVYDVHRNINQDHALADVPCGCVVGVIHSH